MNKKHSQSINARETVVKVETPTDDKLAKLESSVSKLQKDLKQTQKNFQEKEFDIYSRIIDRETDIFSLEYKVRDLKTAIIALCITLIGYFVINIVKIVWTK